MLWLFVNWKLWLYVLLNFYWRLWVRFIDGILVFMVFMVFILFKFFFIILDGLVLVLCNGVFVIFLLELNVMLYILVLIVVLDFVLLCRRLGRLDVWLESLFVSLFLFWNLISFFFMMMWVCLYGWGLFLFCLIIIFLFFFLEDFVLLDLYLLLEVFL